MPNAKRRCTCCKEYGPADDGIKTIAGWFLSAGHVLAYSKRKQEKDRAKQDRAERQSFKQKKVAFYTNDLTRQKALTQAAANKLCSLLDEGRPCISCGRLLRGGRAQHASHFKSRGANSAIRYSLLNLHLSCVVCNAHLSGNVEGYRRGLKERYGQWILDYLDNAPRSYEWTCEELIELRALLNEECRRVKAGLQTLNDWRALPEQEQA